MPPVERVDDRMKRLGFGFGGGGEVMEESEPEEGEACFGKKEDACMNPDVDFSYIDEKLENVLGHLQRDFEGGVSAENLGAKFGGYGSFLPSYKRSPSIVSQLGNPPKDPGHTVVKSPNGLSCEGSCNDLSIQMNASISKNCSTSSKHSNLRCSARNDASTSATRKHIQDHDLMNNGNKGGIKNTLKVRIKLGPDNISARNNAAIYSGLGLELSPSPSSEDSPEGSRGILEEDGIPNESPNAILQMMTSFPISEGYFLSPLPENLLWLTKARDHFSENHRGDLPGKSIPEAISVSCQLTAPLRSTKSCRETSMKPLPENIQIGRDKSKQNDDISVILEKKVNIQQKPERQELTFQTSRIPIRLSSGAAEFNIMVRKVISKTQEDSVKDTKMTFDQSSCMLSNDNIFHSSVAKRNTFESKRSVESEGIVSLKEEAVCFEVKPSSRIKLSGGDSVEENMIYGNDLSYMQKACMEKPENDINLNEVQLDEPKDYKDHIFGTNEFIKLSGAQKTDTLPELKRKLKATAANATSVSDPPQKAMVSLSSLSGKEENKFHARSDPAENKSKRLKSQKESSHDFPKQSQREAAWEGKGEQVVGRTELMVAPLIAKNRLRDIKITKKKSRVRSVDDKSGNSSFEAPVEAFVDALICNHSASDAAVAPHGPIVIKDNWACCDVCEKWRLLPNGTNPDDLPKKWTCNMQLWLPIGMNSCVISEEETTMIMNPQCQTSLLESNANHENSASLTSSATVHVNQVTLGTGSRIASDCNQVRRPSDTSTERWKQKIKGKVGNIQFSSDGVNIISRRCKDSKLMSKGLINPDIFVENKLMNPNGFHHLNKDGKLVPDLASKVAPYLAIGSYTSELTGRNMGEVEDKFLNNSTRNLKGSLSSLNGTVKTHLGHTVQEFKKVSVIDTQMSDKSVVPVKKRKAREWNDIQNNQETAMRSQHQGENAVMLGEDTSRSELKKENRANASNYAAEEYNTSKVSGTMEKSHDKTRITSRIGKMLIDEMVENHVAGGQLGQNESHFASEQPCDFTTLQPSAGGNSSSSKLSSSCRNKANFQESGGSPLDSVSSSPLRVYSSEKCSKIRNSVGKTNAKHVGASAIERSKRCSDGEVDGKMGQGSRRKEKTYFVQQKSLGSSLDSKCRVLSPLDGACNDHVKASSSLDGGKAKSGIPSCMSCGDVRGNLLPSEVGGINVVNSVSIICDQHRKHPTEPLDKKPFQNQYKLNGAPGNDEDIASCHCDRDRTVISESGKRLCFRNRSNTSECEFNEGKMKLSNVFSEQEGLHSLRNGKQGTPNQGPHSMSSVKAQGLEVCPSGETVSGLLNVDKQAKDSDNKNVARHGSSRREKVNELDGQCPMRNYAPSSAAVVAMKEAKELKHAADRMKNVGKELEGTALYFQAALKFLQAASLSEPFSVVNMKYDELNESLMTYTQTASLCEFCAREYEKRKDMAFAALAYKCMEVAYFKVAFFKNHVASRDHHELQATIQTFSQGDSPSSSASDLDNLNQPGAIEKATYSKVVNSLQIAGNHVIASRPSFSRWLDYTNVSISALEASMKSHNALSVASSSIEKNGFDSIALVKEALNFNFHNVEELLRRIRAAMESFNH